MAELQRMAGVLAQVQQDNAQLRAENANLNRGAMAALGTSLPQLVAAMEKRLDKDSTKSLVDTKGIGKPPSFTDKESEFQVWSKKTANFLISVYPELEAPLEWAAEEPDPFDRTRVVTEFGDQHDILNYVAKIAELDHQIHTVLSQLTFGEGFDIVNNVPGRCGLEAWRKLHKRFDPTTGGRRRNVLRAIINPTKVTVDQLSGAIERWEELVRRYESKKVHGVQRTMDEDIKMAAFEALLPAELATHVTMNSARLATYAAMRAEVVLILEAKTGVKMKSSVGTGSGGAGQGGPDDMDVGSFGKAKGGKGGKGNGKTGKPKSGTGGNSAAGAGGGKAGGSKKFDGNCNYCHKYGHKEADCYNKQKAGGQGAGKGGGKADAGGKGKHGKGKHGKGANSLETAAGTEPEAEVGTLDLCSLNPSLAPSATLLLEPDAGKRDISALESEARCAWTKINVDTGAAMSVYPLKLASARGQSSGQMFKTASGEHISDEGPVRFVGIDELDNQRKLGGRLADVHKPLMSAAEVCDAGQDLWVGTDGGYLIPRYGPIGRGLRAEFEKLCKRHGRGTLLPVYKENNVFNVYMKLSEAAVAKDVCAGDVVAPPGSDTVGTSAGGVGPGPPKVGTVGNVAGGAGVGGPSGGTRRASQP